MPSVTAQENPRHPFALVRKADGTRRSLCDTCAMGELETLRIFLAVAEHRSFAGAARALGLTPASVTRAIAGLEA